MHLSAASVPSLGPAAGSETHRRPAMRDARTSGFGVIELPAGCELVRATREFDEQTVPAALLAAHRVADGVWGRLVVREGALRFGFDDETTERLVTAGSSQVIPPGRLHHLTVDGAVRFVVEFHRPVGPVP